MDVRAVRIWSGGHRYFSGGKSHQLLNHRRFVSTVQSGLACIFLAQSISFGADYIGATQCKSCHLREFQKQAQSAHALALSKVTLNPRKNELPLSDLWARAPGISCKFTLLPDGLYARMSDGTESRDAVLEWAFGAGSQGITFLGKLPGQAYLEFSLSYYTKTHVFGITPGHEPIHPTAAVQAMGRPFETYGSSGEILECFQCHSTGPVGVSPRDSIEPLELGIRCEACHGPGSAHRDEVVHGHKNKAVAMIQSPGRLSASELNGFCGGCHRRQTPGRAQLDLAFSWNVRHQPPYLERSKCFRQSAGRLSCLTCHDPHESAVRGDSGFYNRKCISCHGSQTSESRVCKVAGQGNCIDCHMPTVRPSEYMEFRSHWIGIYAPQGPAGSARFIQPRS